MHREQTARHSRTPERKDTQMGTKMTNEKQ